MYLVGMDIEVTLNLTKNGAPYNLGANPVIVEHERPKGEKGSWTPTIVNATNGIIKVLLTHGQNTQPGTWKMWARVTEPGELEVVTTGGRLTVVPLGTVEP